MKKILIILAFFWGIPVFSQDFYTLYFTTGIDKINRPQRDLSRSDQYYRVKQSGDTTFVYNNALEFVVLGNKVNVYFGNERSWEGEYRVDKWFNGDHIIFFFKDLGVYYFFFQYFDWMKYPEAPVNESQIAVKE